MDTVTLTIDGRPVTVPKGRTVLQAAIESGIKIPYYCYHPGLGIDGSCRVCIVKIEKMPKLQTSCSTTVADGMVVSTQTPDVVEARASVFEFLLINHPLDCPVCDKGGECPLQDFSYSFGPNESRMEFPRRVFDGEGVRADVDFGPTLMLNRNRCILCTRCVRFMREVETDAQINIVDRGYGSEIATFQEEGVHSLLSGNLMDVCPVGAITTRDYRFKSRPWDNPDAVDTICTLCEKGCNTTAWLKAKPEWAKGASLIRMTPRFNPEVNSYWMCDIGRFDYRWIEGDERLQRPLLRTEADTLEPTDWRNAAAKVVDRVTAAGGPAALRFFVSAHASLEELALIGRIGGALGVPEHGVAISWRRRDKPQPPGATFRIPADDAPNLLGASDLGFPVRRTPAGDADLSAFSGDILAGGTNALYVFDPGPEGSIGDVSLDHRGEALGCIEAPDRAGGPADAARAGRRHRPARRRLGREGRILRQRAGAVAGCRARHRASGRSDGRLADLRQHRRRPRGAVGLHVDPGNPRRHHRRAAERRTICGAHAVWRSHGRYRLARGCRRRTRRNAGSGTSCSRTCRR